MTSMTFTDARNHLSELLDEVESTHERVVITRHGTVAAVLISPDDLAALEETLEVLSNPELMQQLNESRRALATGDVVSGDTLAALIARRMQ